MFIKKFANWFDLDYRVKPDNDNLENVGRSMVEMLGVLAIIGVLSVGAISGYSKAMFKYKLNKHTEQMNTIINAVARNLHSFDNLLANKGKFNLTNTFVKMGEIPTEMQHNENYIRDVFGLLWFIEMQNVDAGRTFDFATNEASALKNKSADNLKICHNIITVAKENSDSIYTVSKVIYNEDSGNWNSSVLYGDTYCTSDRPCLKNLSLDDIYNFCTKFAGIAKPQIKISWSLK